MTHKEHKWFGTEGGVSEFDGQTWTTYTTADGLANNHVQAIAIDRVGHKWFGTAGYGVSRFDGQSWTTYTTADGLSGSYVYAVAVDPTGSIWFATNGGVSQFDGQTWTSYTSIRSELGTLQGVQTLALDQTGDVWAGFGDRGEGVSLVNVAKYWPTFTKEQGLSDNTVTAITVDEDGYIWFGTPVGLTRLGGKSYWTWTTYLYPGPAGRQVQAIAIGEAGAKWFGYRGQGVDVFDRSGLDELHHRRWSVRRLDQCHCC